MHKIVIFTYIYSTYFILFRQYKLFVDAVVLLHSKNEKL